MKPTVILVGADKGGVGKTTVSRTLLDYLAARKISARAFDTEFPRGTLKRFHPDETEVVNITSASDQMRILHTVETSGAKVVAIDVRAGHFAITLKALRDIGFLAAVKDGRCTLVVLHILGSSIASLEEIAATAADVKDAAYFLVKNFINDTTFFEWAPQTYASYFEQTGHAGEIVIPKLNEMAYEQVELAGVPFSAFAADRKADGSAANNSFVLRGYVRAWQKAVAAEFDRIGLAAIVAGKQPAARDA